MNSMQKFRHHQTLQKGLLLMSSNAVTKTERKPVVWVTNYGGHPYEKAERFGRLIPLTKGSVNPFKLDRIAYSVGLLMQEAQEEDFVLISGMPVVVGLIMSMWLAKFRKVKMLQWSIRKQDYEHTTLYAETVTRNALQVGDMSA